MPIFVGRGLPHRAHLVQIYLETSAGQLQSRLAACKSTTDYTNAFVHQFVITFR